MKNDDDDYHIIEGMTLYPMAVEYRKLVKLYKEEFGRYFNCICKFLRKAKGDRDDGTE